MRCNLTPDEITQVKTKYEAWLELQDEKKALSEADKKIREEASEVFEGKASDATKLFKAMKAEENGEDNDLDEIGSVFECIRTNGVQLMPEIERKMNEIIERLDKITQLNQQLLNIFLKYDQGYNEEIIKDQGRTDLMK